jgi:hypothetical protein
MFLNLPNASVRTIFDAAVIDDRVHLQTITVPLRLGTAPSNLSGLLRGSVLQPLLMAGLFDRGIRLSIQPRKRTGGQCALLNLKRRNPPPAFGWVTVGLHGPVF